MEHRPVSSPVGNNVNVKIPVTNTKGEFSGALIRRLSADGIELNVTAVFSLDQVTRVTEKFRIRKYRPLYRFLPGELRTRASIRSR